MCRSSRCPCLWSTQGQPADIAVSTCKVQCCCRAHIFVVNKVSLQTALSSLHLKQPSAAHSFQESSHTSPTLSSSSSHNACTMSHACSNAQLYLVSERHAAFVRGPLQDLAIDWIGVRQTHECIIYNECLGYKSRRQICKACSRRQASRSAFSSHHVSCSATCCLNSILFFRWDSTSRLAPRSEVQSRPWFGRVLLCPRRYEI